MSRFLDKFRLNLSGNSPDASLQAANSALPATQQGWGSLDLTLDGIVLLNNKGIILDANTRALEFLHSSLPAVSGYDFWDVVPEEIAKQHQEATDLAFRSSARHTFLAHQSFESSWVEYTFRQHPTGYVVNLREADSVQKLQRLLEDGKRCNQLIFEANPNVMWVFDLTSLRIFCRQPGCRQVLRYCTQGVHDAWHGSTLSRGRGCRAAALLAPGHARQGGTV